MVFGYNEESSCSNNEENKIYEKFTSSSGPIDLPWPTYGHDNRHTSQRSFNTIVDIDQIANTAPPNSFFRVSIDEEWNKSFGGALYDYGYSVRQTTDGGYIITGSYENNNNRGEIWLIKTDDDGDIDFMSPKKEKDGFEVQ